MNHLHIMHLERHKWLIVKSAGKSEIAFGPVSQMRDRS